MIFFSFLVITKNSDYTVSEYFISKFEFTGNQVYVTYNSENRLSTKSFSKDELPTEVDNMISYQKSSELYILYWSLLVFCSLFVILPIFINDDVSWEFEDVLVKTTKQFIECHTENDGGKEFFYYVILKIYTKIRITNDEIKNYNTSIWCDGSVWIKFKLNGK